MAQEDIYRNKRRYERYIADLEELLLPGKFLKSQRRGHQRKYYCKNPKNLQHFSRLHKIFEARDTSYARRLRLFCTLLFAVHTVDKELGAVQREDVDQILRASHRVNLSIESKKTIVWNLKFIWKVLFPERDPQGREDETVVPYVVRHLRANCDRSQQTLRGDRLTWEEYERIVEYFSGNPQMQAYTTLAIESFGRPQELCFRTLGDIEMHEGYAKIWVSSHGKEGVKMLQCIDSFPYLMKWLQQHPYKDDPEAFLFMSNRQRDEPAKPNGVNKYLRNATRDLRIDKRITAYSLKRNGITFSRLRGDADVDIQRRAGWTSTRQLQTYDMSTSHDALQRELVKRGLAKGNLLSQSGSSTKMCICGARIGFSEKVCSICKRVTDKKVFQRELQAEQQVKRFFSLAMENPTLSFQELVRSTREVAVDMRP
jgi:integrase